MTRPGQDSEELRVFRAFAGVSSLPIILNSIEKRSPPEPDILCQVEDVGPRAFEVVELVDDGLAREAGSEQRLERELLEEFARQSGAAPDFKQRLADAYVAVWFHARSTLNERRRSMGPLVQLLRDLSPNFLGELAIPHTAEFHALWMARVFRGYQDGPLFDIALGGGLGDPSTAKIASKLTRSYSASCPVDLLAFWGQQPPMPNVIWVPRVQVLLEAQLSGSPFERCWVYDSYSRSIPFVFPELPNGSAF